MGFALLSSVFKFIYVLSVLYVIGFGSSKVFCCSPEAVGKTADYCISQAEGLGIVLKSTWWEDCLCRSTNIQLSKEYTDAVQGRIYQASIGELRDTGHPSFKTDISSTTESFLKYLSESLGFAESEKLQDQVLVENPIPSQSSRELTEFQETIPAKESWAKYDRKSLASSPSVLPSISSSLHRKSLSIPLPCLHRSLESCIKGILSPKSSSIPGVGNVLAPASVPMPSAFSPAKSWGPSGPVSSLASLVPSSHSPAVAPTVAIFIPTKSSSLKAVAVAVPITAVCTLIFAGLAFCLYRKFYALKSSDLSKANDKPKDDKPLLHPWYSGADLFEKHGQDHIVESQSAYAQESDGKIMTQTNFVKPAEVKYVKKSDKAAEGMSWEFGGGQWEGAVYSNMAYHPTFSNLSTFSRSESFSFSHEFSVGQLGFPEILLDHSGSLHRPTPETLRPSLSESSSNPFSSITNAPAKSSTLSSLDGLSLLDASTVGRPSVPISSTSVPQRPPRPPPQPYASNLLKNHSPGTPQRLPLPPILIRSEILRTSEAQKTSSVINDPLLHPFPTSLPMPSVSDSFAAVPLPTSADPVTSSTSVSPSHLFQPGLPLVPPPPPPPVLPGSSFRPMAPPVPPPAPLRATTPAPPPVPIRPPPPPSQGPAPPPKVPLPPKVNKDQKLVPPLRMGNDNKKDEASLPKLKPLFWDKVKANTDHSMVWDRLESGSFRVDEDMMNMLFGYAPPATPVQQAKSQPSTTVKGPKILDAKRAQNIAIQLRPLAVTRDEIHDALLEGDGLSIEALEALLKMAPTQDEERKLRDYNGDVAQLDPAEHFLITILEVPLAFQRVRDMLYRASFAEELVQVEKALKTLKAACTELKGSRTFRKMLEAVLKTGNRMNMGTYRGDARGFKLDTLLKLSDVKSVDGKFTLLHFVIQEILRNESSRANHLTEGKISLKGASSSLPLEGDLKNSSGGLAGRTQIKMNIIDVDQNHEKDDFVGLGSTMVMGMNMELANVKSAADLDITMLKSSVAKLTSGLQRIKDAVTPEQYDKRLSRSRNRSISFSEDSYQSSMRNFVNKSEKDISTIQDELNEVLEMVKYLNTYFENEPSKDEANLCRVFQIVKDFLALLDKACRDVSKLKENGPKSQ